MLSVRRGGGLSVIGNERERVMPSRKAKAKQRISQATAGYSNRSLADKLGITVGAIKAILEAPEGFESLIGTHEFDTSLDLDSYDYLHYFTASMLALETIFPILAKRLNPGGILWISWPKLASGMQTDLGESAVRKLGLATGLVDVKICAIDGVWSGLKFMHRRTTRAI
jgi:hypothetical protein